MGISPSQKVLLNRLLKEASQLVLENDLEEAVVLFSKALVIDSTNLVALSKRSSVFLQLGLNESALTDAQNALSSHPSSPKAHLSLAKVLIKIKDFENVSALLSNLRLLTCSDALLDEASLLESQLPLSYQAHDSPPLEPWSPQSFTQSIRPLSLSTPKTESPSFTSSRRLKTPKKPPAPKIETVAFDTSPASVYLEKTQKSAKFSVDSLKIDSGKHSEFREHLFNKIQNQLEESKIANFELLDWENRQK
ncbi:hypothetical protein P9112_007977 [Eukaryota sp. TZLM1-RC]